MFNCMAAGKAPICPTAYFSSPKELKDVQIVRTLCG